MLTALAVVGLAVAHQIHSLREDRHYRDYSHELQMAQLRDAIEQHHLQQQLEQAAAQQAQQQAQQAQQQTQDQICALQQTVDGTNAAVQQLCSAVTQLTQSVHDGQVATGKRFCSIEAQLEELRKEQAYLKKQLRQNNKGGGNNHNP